MWFIEILSVLFNMLFVGLVRMFSLAEHTFFFAFFLSEVLVETSSTRLSKTNILKLLAYIAAYTT